MKVTPVMIRTALKSVSNNRPVPVSVAELLGHLGLTTQTEKKRVHNILSELRIRGEIDRKGLGLYQVVSLKSPPLKTIMWRLLKMRRTVTIEDLMEMSGATKNYATEWIRLLKKREIVKRSGPCRYTLINEDAAEPETTAAAARMRRWKAAKKKALAALDDAVRAIDTARKALDD